ncbi:MAG: hypothetical protein KBD85_03825 [Elusimicrobia bacterium]|nr:hypothetical protein [Elusimicrobiota bacterium]MBP9127265.1 hypothetical protein [Elusimicrobiota bacterium]MBP9699127.1 hypothetical protein [Elusimicrobiota bacterium]
MTSQRPPSFALFESLSESRISVLYLARRAKETKDMALAKELTEKGQSLKIEMARISTSGAPSAALSESGRIRRTLTADWNKESTALLKRSKTAQSELAKLAANKEFGEQFSEPGRGYFGTKKKKPICSMGG